MVTIISASNRLGNYTSLFAKKCEELFKEKGVEVQLLELDSLPKEVALQSVYEYDTSVFADYAKKYFKNVDKFLFIIPEYNGSFPGILKLFIDAIHPRNYEGKKAALIGVSAGRAGNLRGMDHLTDILHYLQVTVMPHKLPVSQLNKLVDGEKIIDKVTLELLETQVQKLIEF
ncbi:MAG: NADPH-dependent FMN reductase [Flavobacteriales bacterium]|mgnify:CR=1 FL=1|nr:NADPH-dependent FMN reductase [Flavobacteriales bacterium]